MLPSLPQEIENGSILRSINPYLNGILHEYHDLSHDKSPIQQQRDLGRGHWSYVQRRPFHSQRRRHPHFLRLHVLATS